MAIETFRQWNFGPSMIGDTPVATKVLIPFTIDWYRLRRKICTESAQDESNDEPQRAMVLADKHEVRIPP
jgi:hypothetical protein